MPSLLSVSSEHLLHVDNGRPFTDGVGLNLTMDMYQRNDTSLDWTIALKHQSCQIKLEVYVVRTRTSELLAKGSVYRKICPAQRVTHAPEHQSCLHKCPCREHFVQLKVPHTRKNTRALSTMVCVKNTSSALESQKRARTSEPLAQGPVQSTFFLA